MHWPSVSARRVRRLLVLALLGSLAAAPVDARDAQRVRGLLVGTLFGDALGGPIEFQGHPEIQRTNRPPKLWRDGEVLDRAAIEAAAARLWLRPYKPLRPLPEPYAHWSRDAAPGTVTDDSRHKMILLAMLRNAATRRSWPVSSETLAQTYLQWCRSKPGICDEWLAETYRAARWHLGERDLSQAYPTERLWNGLPTCYGQMALTPIAALFPGEPEKAYRAAYDLAFFDNSWGRDMNAALVAGLSVALTVDADTLGRAAAWARIIDAMRATDPYGYKVIPWTPRSVDVWLDRARGFVERSGKQPARLFAILDDELRNAIKWEAEVPFVVMFAVLQIADYDPLAALQISIEWGHDHDSYAQLLGAFVGALHGEDVFAPEWRRAIDERLLQDYGERVDEWADTLSDVRDAGRRRTLIRAASGGANSPEPGALRANAAVDR